jgi:hypothetical protein
MSRRSLALTNTISAQQYVCTRSRSADDAIGRNGEESIMATQAERRTATTEALIAAAREAFVKDRFTATSVYEDATRVGMS